MVILTVANYSDLTLDVLFETVRSYSDIGLEAHMHVKCSIF
jgi:hypothetical protein